MNDDPIYWDDLMPADPALRRAEQDKNLDALDARWKREQKARELLGKPATIPVKLGPHTVQVPRDLWALVPGGMTNSATITFPKLPPSGQAQIVEGVWVGPQLVPLTCAITLMPDVTASFPAGALTICVE
jgi:hypothetical protein